VERKLQKRKKTVKPSIPFCAFGIFPRKGVRKTLAKTTAEARAGIYKTTKANLEDFS
jgi:hypothetical protein